MKKCARYVLSAVLIAAMVFSSSGLAFASENGIQKDILSKNDAVQKAKTSERQGTRGPEQNRDFKKSKERAGSFTAGSSESGKLSRNGAAVYVAEAGNKKYTSLQAAVNSVKSGEVVTVLTDITGESIVIDPGERGSMTINFDGHKIRTGNAEDVITVRSGRISIVNAEIVNTKTGTDTGEICTAVYAKGTAAVFLGDCKVSVYADDAVGFYAGNDSDMTTCECDFIDGYFRDGSGVSPDNISGYYVEKNAELTISLCGIEVYNGNGVDSSGKTTINDAYIAVQGDDGCGIIARESGKVYVNDGYYYADTALFIKNRNSSAVISKGEFSSGYTENSAIYGFDGTKNFGSNVTIAKGSMASPSNWRTHGACDIDVYYKYPAPGTVKAKLSKYNGISLSWSRVSGAEAYRVYYKKSSEGSWSLLSRTRRTTISKTGLSPGTKYDFKIHPCDVLDRTVEPKYCNSSSYKTASVYTLKKLSTPKVSKKSTSSVTVSWTGIKGVAGYQISKSTSRSGTSIVSTYKTTSGKSKVIKASKGKTYYYKVRAYALDSKGNKVYAPWSAVKSYKLK